jgi:hypothetical protein
MNLGKVGDALPADGDANGDLNVDGGDLLVWQQQFTGPPPATAAAVPEPSIGLLATIAAIGWQLAAGRRKRNEAGSL